MLTHLALQRKSFSSVLLTFINEVLQKTGHEKESPPYQSHLRHLILLYKDLAWKSFLLTFKSIYLKHGNTPCVSLCTLANMEIHQFLLIKWVLQVHFEELSDSKLQLGVVLTLFSKCSGLKHTVCPIYRNLGTERS